MQKLSIKSFGDVYKEIDSSILPNNSSFFSSHLNIVFNKENYFSKLAFYRLTFSCIPFYQTHFKKQLCSKRNIIRTFHAFLFIQLILKNNFVPWGIVSGLFSFLLLLSNSFWKQLCTMRNIIRTFHAFLFIKLILKNNFVPWEILSGLFSFLWFLSDSFWNNLLGFFKIQMKWKLKHLTSVYSLTRLCTILHYIALYCAIYCTILHYIALYCTILHYIALYCTILHYIALYCTILHYSAL